MDEIAFTLDEGSLNLTVRVAMQKKAAAILAIPSRNASALHRIVGGQVVENYNRLAWGGSIPDANGHDIIWSRNRSAMTVHLRQSAGLGALFPMLTFTGKLGLGLQRGTSSTSVGRYSWRPDASALALINVHQKGLAPLPSRTSSVFKQASRPLTSVPPRPIVFWSRSMARQFAEFIRAQARNA